MEAPNARKHIITACPVCGAGDFRFRFLVGQDRLVRCHACHFAFLNPQPSDNELAAIYSQNYFLGAGQTAKEPVFARLKLRTAETYLDQLTAYAGFSHGRLLEIGSGSGSMLVAAARRGFDVTGVEYSEHACQAARQRLAAEGLKGELVGGEIEAIADRKGEFDACVLADLIEHVRHPRQFLRMLRGVLRPGAVVLVATPSLDSWSARLMSARWMEFKPEHLSYFNRRTLERLLRSEGFQDLALAPGYKILNYDYIQEHFEKFPTPFYTRAVKALGACLPPALKSHELRLVASGLVLLGRSGEPPASPRAALEQPAARKAAGSAGPG
ncbi:MAG: class I SAM-dependent methyltransferase [Opitutales bacterium]